MGQECRSGQWGSTAVLKESVPVARTRVLVIRVEKRKNSGSSFGRANNLFYMGDWVLDRQESYLNPSQAIEITYL